MAKIGLPDIDITFSQKAITAISRSERGVLLILCVDTVAKELRTRTYRYENEIRKNMDCTKKNTICTLTH